MKRLLSGGIAGVLLAAVSVLSAPTASATAQVTTTIPYDCNIPIFGHKTLNVEVEVDIPPTGSVGVPIHFTNFHVIVPIPSDVYGTFTPFGASQVDITYEFELVVTMNGGSTGLPLNGSGPLTQIPNPPGPDMAVGGSAQVPVYTPPTAGTAIVSLGPNGVVHMTPRDSAGNPTILGTLDMPCTATGDTTLGTISVS